ncbi:hypothetical protein Ade02nite_24110 [Paractinoplanes deccanensis]|uniref:Uncharacterized protein n=1 Tax=Paractinoplanes deccanensis TaxID=113561 RepID=A0ABQ3Y1N3_9ACTN|nr:hypothetical protein [Actinoplanes deccanensis]GID73770.1 hypothetical protein Ade02nite_24110 [Actinoplanes deccanensis]
MDPFEPRATAPVALTNRQDVAASDARACLLDDDPTTVGFALFGPASVRDDRLIEHG